MNDKINKNRKRNAEGELCTSDAVVCCLNDITYFFGHNILNFEDIVTAFFTLKVCLCLLSAK